MTGENGPCSLRRRTIRLETQQTICNRCVISGCVSCCLLEACERWRLTRPWPAVAGGREEGFRQHLHSPASPIS